jgi:hypothetical protein
MHAVVVTVSIAPGQVEASRKALREQVVPRVSHARGFVKGYGEACSTLLRLSARPALPRLSWWKGLAYYLNNIQKRSGGVDLRCSHQ